MKLIEKYIAKLLRFNMLIIAAVSLGIALSFILFYIFYKWEQTTNRIDFELDSIRYANAVQNYINRHIEVLYLFGNFYNTIDRQVTRHEFSKFAIAALSRYPDIQAFSWNPLVIDDERAAYELQAKNEGIKNFRFTERNKKGELVDAPKRQEYVTVHYIEPLKDNKKALGYVISSEVNLLQAINLAFRTGKLVMTNKMTLVQEKNSQTGVLLLLPIYHHGVSLNTLADRHKYRKGFIVEVLHIGEVIKSALKCIPDVGINVYLYDLSSEKKDLLYFHPSKYAVTNISHMEKDALLTGLPWSYTFDIGGRKWELIFTPSSFNIHPQYSWVVLLCGLVLTLIFGSYLLTRNRNAIKTKNADEKLQKETGQRVRAAESLKTNEELTTDILMNLPVGVAVLTEQDFKFTHTNEFFAKFNGISSEEHIGKTLKEIVHPSTSKSIISALQKVRDTGVPIQQYGLDTPLPSGEVRNLLYWLYPLNNHDSMVVVAADITKQKKLEQQLIQAKKMEAIGQLAAGLAHEINNPNGYIASNLEALDEYFKTYQKVFLILDELIAVTENSKQEDLHDLIKKIKKIIIKEDICYINSDVPNLISRSLQGSEIIKEIVYNLKSFSHIGGKNKIEFNINECIEQALLIAWNQIKYTCEVNKSLGELKPTLGYPEQIIQVVINLLINAGQAIAENGQIKITSYYKNGYNIIKIQDNGKGIAKEELNNIFNPFFTTKSAGVGAGLGLSISYDIVVDNHGGTMKVQSEENSFTEFIIYLPAITI